jgi:virginiamycin A acetyltransferase
LKPREVPNDAVVAKSGLPSRILERLYVALGCPERWRVGAIIIDCLLRLEGGMQHSNTARRLLSLHHKVHIGEYSYGPCFRPGYFPPEVRIGRYTSIAEGVRVVNENHPLDRLTTHPLAYRAGERRRELRIGNDVWIGFNAIILPGCSEIATGAVVGAGAVVTRDVPAYAIVVGNPARISKYRFSAEVVERLLRSCWWEHSPEEINFGECPGLDVLAKHP